MPAYIVDNAKNRFILDWGNTRVERSSANPGLKLVSEPKVQKIRVTSMEAQGDGTVKVKYQSFVGFDVEDGVILGTGADQVVVFEKTNGKWMLKDAGRFPWGLEDYDDEYERLYGQLLRNSTKACNYCKDC